MTTWLVLGAILLLVVVYLGIGALAASQLTRPRRTFDASLGPASRGLPYEDLRLPARGDGLQIAAWYIPSGENRRAIILVHGRDNSRTNAFVDQFVTFAGALRDAGFSVMMIDLRGHGQSADSRYYFGIRERRDILGAVDWLQGRGYQAARRAAGTSSPLSASCIAGCCCRATATASAARSPGQPRSA